MMSASQPVHSLFASIAITLVCLSGVKLDSGSVLIRKLSMSKALLKRRLCFTYSKNGTIAIFRRGN